MKLDKILTPQVRTFLYGTIAALLSVATVQGWVSNDLAESITNNLPTIVGALGSIIAAANVQQKPAVVKTEIVAPIVPDRVDSAPQGPTEALVSDPATNGAATEIK
jgi:hypothetical protein